MRDADLDGRLRAVVIDEWAVLRSGVSAVLQQCGVEVVAQTADLPAGARLAARNEVDLVVLGALTGVAPGLAVRALRTTHTGGSVLVLLATPSRRDALELLDGGAAAVLAREATEGELREAVMRAARGERFLSQSLLGVDVDLTAGADDDGLTDRELAVLRELSAGQSNRQIASALYIGEATVKTHLHNIYAKLEVANRVQAIGRARQRGLLAS